MAASSSAPYCNQHRNLCLQAEIVLSMALGKDRSRRWGAGNIHVECNPKEGTRGTLLVVVSSKVLCIESLNKRAELSSGKELSSAANNSAVLYNLQSCTSKHLPAVVESMEVGSDRSHT